MFCQFRPTYTFLHGPWSLSVGVKKVLPIEQTLILGGGGIFALKFEKNWGGDRRP